MIGICHSAAPLGVSARLVEVEVDIRQGHPSIAFAGLPDKAVREAGDRVKAALRNSGYWFPSQMHVVVNLAPGDLRKEGSAYDLPIAVGILLATEQIAAPRVADHLVLGELSLDGRLRPIRGALCMADHAARQGRWRGLLLPAENAGEASLARGLPAYPVTTLVEAVRFLAGAADLRPFAAAPDPREDLPGPDFSEVRGQESAVRAALLAAAGGHNLLLVGPPGSGKTMIAERLPGILPPLRTQESIEATKIHSVAGTLRGPCIRVPPFRAPHHTVSAAGLLGGGLRVNPGEITLAHRGVLFLDELPEFDRRSLEGLREPLERGEVSVVRALYRVRFPSRFLLVAAMNPCMCGNHGVPDRACTCTPPQVANYRGRVSGPLLDRIDLQVRVPAVSAAAMGRNGREGPASASLRDRVTSVREVQARRGMLNAALSLKDLDVHAPLDREGESLLAKVADRHRLSARALVRMRRLARTIADLDGAASVAPGHLKEAVGFRIQAEG